MSPAGRHGSDASSNHHPDLNAEVATLSTKLINAINHQTVLDDTLSSTRHELKSANDRIRDLEAQNASQREILAGDVWVRRSAVEIENRGWQAKIEAERAKTLEMEKSKKKIEQELENLTTALFEEANKMVIRAKEDAQAEQDALQRKNDNLKSQLLDSETLLKSQQEQLSKLKTVMETMTSERDDCMTNPTAPSSPGFPKVEIRDEDRYISLTPSTSGPLEALSPAPPTSFSHLIQPVLRFDIATYDDFVNLARLSRNRTANRVSSGSTIAGLNLSSLGLGGSTSSAPQSPHTPASSDSTSPASAPIPNLKDTRFFKRALTEDIDPTLRLDAAPGLSWLARRSVLNAMTDGSLVVDPVTTHAGNSFLMSTAKPQFHPCSLCGETRQEPEYLRNHRFRTSEQDSAQRYPLCKYCLGRVRSTCDFLSFLRMVKDGHWKADDDDQERAAWEESVRLRETMFWARMGGGVVPSNHHHHTAVVERSFRPSQEHTSSDDIPAITTDTSPEDLEPITTTESNDTQNFEDVPEPESPSEQTVAAKNIRNSSQSLDANSKEFEGKRLSITIPKDHQDDSAFTKAA